MRNPSISLTYSDVVRLLEGKISNPKKVADILLEDGRALACDRSIVVTKSKLSSTKKVNTKVAIPDVDLFNMVLTTYRSSLKHRFVPLRKEDALWKHLASVTADALVFSKSFEYETHRQAFQDYIRIGIDLMRDKYSLSKFTGYKEKIWEVRNLEVELRADDDVEATELFGVIFQSLMKSECGEYVSIELFTKKLDIYRGRMDADRLGADYKQYIKAQISGLEWTGGAIDTYNLYGDNAIERFKAYKIPVESKSSEYAEKLKKLVKAKQ